MADTVIKQPRSVMNNQTDLNSILVRLVAQSFTPSPKTNPKLAYRFLWKLTKFTEIWLSRILLDLQNDSIKVLAFFNAVVVDISLL